MLDKKILKKHPLIDKKKTLPSLLIRKNDLIQVIWNITKKRKQKIKGICKSYHSSNIHPTIRIKYKISGEFVEQIFPLNSKFLTSVEKLNV